MWSAGARSRSNPGCAGSGDFQTKNGHVEAGFPGFFVVETA
jgi:hypothetical protein